MKKLFVTLPVLISLMCISSQSWALPNCNSVRPFHNCFGSHTWGDGGKYIGEWRDDVRHGKGTFYGDGYKYIGQWKNGKYHGQGTFTRYEYKQGTVNKNGYKYIGQWKNGLPNGQGIKIYSHGVIEEGIWKNNKFMYAQKIQKIEKKYVEVSKPNTSSKELDAERQKRKDLERKLAALENKQKQEQQRINTDNQIPTISAFLKQNGSNATISGRVTDNTEVAEVLIDGQELQLSPNGTFKTDFYIPRTGKTIEIVAFDTKGNKAIKTMKIKRGNIQQANVQKFKSLNPSLKRVKANPNALALIIGISDYENTKASALYADSDAKTFYDYANLKLGIPSSNIQE